jgi:nuclear pore complex protein Nup205
MPLCPKFFLANRLNTGIPTLLSYYQSLLSLLQQLSQTKIGATHVLNAGLFAAVRESKLFAADPDIGIGLLCLPHV